MFVLLAVIANAFTPVFLPHRCSSLQGIDASRPEIKAELEAVAIGEMVDMDVLLAHPESICCKAMTGNLAMKDWSGFTSTMCVPALTTVVSCLPCSAAGS